MVTIREKLVIVMEALGYLREEKTRASNYLVYYRPNGGYYFIGRHGALRRGRTVRDSFSLDSLGWIEKNAPDSVKAILNGNSTNDEEEYI